MIELVLGIGFAMLAFGLTRLTARVWGEHPSRWVEALELVAICGALLIVREVWDDDGRTWLLLAGFLAGGIGIWLVRTPNARHHRA